MNIYQVAGLDHCERGFTRQIEVRETVGAYEAVLRYETLRIAVKDQPTESMAVAQVIDQLHRRGFSQLRTRLQFKGETYLGSQEMWMDHSEPAMRAPLGSLEKALNLLRKVL